jgi:hypothetical protein
VTKGANNAASPIGEGVLTTLKGDHFSHFEPCGSFALRQKARQRAFDDVSCDLIQREDPLR